MYIEAPGHRKPVMPRPTPCVGRGHPIRGRYRPCTTTGFLYEASTTGISKQERIGSTNGNNVTPPITQNPLTFRNQIYSDMIQRLVFLLLLGLVTGTLRGQTPDTIPLYGHVVINGMPNSTVYLRPLDHEEDLIPDSTYMFHLNATGTDFQLMYVGYDVQVGQPNTDKDVPISITTTPRKLIISSSEIAPLEATLLDMQGRKVAGSNKQNSPIEFSLDMPQGVYLLHVIQDEQEYISKIRVGLSNTQTSTIYPMAKMLTQDPLTADYILTTNAGDGWVILKDTVELTVGTNQITLTYEPWDTLRGDLRFAFRYTYTTQQGGTGGGSVREIPVKVRPYEFRQVEFDTIIQDTAHNGDLIVPRVPVFIDTIGQGLTDSSKYIVSWPDHSDPYLDSNATYLPFIGWYQGSDTVKVGMGWNQFLIEPVKRPPPNIIGKRYLNVNVQKLRDGSPGSANTPADSALVVVSYSGGLDSAWTDTSGFAQMGPYVHNTTIKIAIGYPGGQDQNGVGYKGYGYSIGYGSITHTIQGTTLNKLAANDTAHAVKVNLIPDSLYSGKSKKKVLVSDIQIKEMDQIGNAHAAYFDTIGYYVDTTTYSNQIAIDNIIEMADTATSWTPLTYVRVMTPFANNGYSPSTATTFSHGANIENGSNYIIPKSFGFGYLSDGSIAIGYVFVDVFVSGGKNEIVKELVYQYLGHNDVGTRPSVMNSNPAPQTDIDVAILTMRHFFYKELFKVYYNPANPGTQNLPINKITDSNQVVP